MRAWAFVLATLLLAASASGCLGDEAADTAEPAGDASTPDGDGSQDRSDDGDAGEDGADGEGEEDQERRGPRVNTSWFNGSVQGQSAPVVGPFCYLDCGNSFDFAVPDGTGALLVELAWEDEATMMLDVDVPFEACDTGIGEDCPPEQASGDEGHLEIGLEAGDEIPSGEWSASAWAEDSPLQAVAFTITASVFEDDEIPPDFSRVHDEGANGQR